MLSMQHVLCGALHYDDVNKFQERIGALVFPDAVRAYARPRQYSHFEQAKDGTDVSWWKFPDDMKHCTKDSVSQSMTDGSHLVEGIQPCVLGESTDIQAFYKHNQHLSPNMFEGVEMHLRQDIVFDDFVREQIDCTGKYDDTFVMDGVEYDGKGVRSLIGEMEQHGLYVLAHDLYEQKGITANQQWFEDVVKPALEKEYSDELAGKTFSFMKMDEKYDAYITNHDWSHLNEGVVSYDDYKDLYQRVESVMSEPSGYRGCSSSRFDRVKMAEGLLPSQVGSDGLDMDYPF